MTDSSSVRNYDATIAIQDCVKAEDHQCSNDDQFMQSADNNECLEASVSDLNGGLGDTGEVSVKEELHEEDEAARDNNLEVVALSTNTRSGRISMRLRLKKERLDVSSPSPTKRPRRSAAKTPKTNGVTSRTDSQSSENGTTEIKVEAIDDCSSVGDDFASSNTIQIDVIEEGSRQRNSSQRDDQMLSKDETFEEDTTSKSHRKRSKGDSSSNNLISDVDQEESEWEEIDEMDKDDPPWKPSIERRKPESNVDRNLDEAVEGLIKDYSIDDTLNQTQVPFASPRPCSSSTSEVCPTSRECTTVPQESVSLEFEGIVAVPVESTKCILCMALFKTTDELKAHMEIVHAKGRRQAKARVTPVEEPDSRKKAPTPLVRVGAEAKPRRRKPRQAGNLGHHECHFCHKRFQQMGHLRNHVRLHTGERPFVCDMCGKEFSQSGHLVSHINSHTNTRPYECQYCQKRFTQSGHLRNHERLHLGVRPYQCAQCGKSFTQSGHLVNHLRLHDGEKPFGCPFCGKRFTQSGHLSTHVKTHNEGRGHECNICFKRFAQASHLEEHSRIHSDLRTFVCAFTACTARFSTGVLLSVHVQLHEQSGQHVEKRGRARERQNGPPATTAQQSYIPDNITPLARHPVIVRVGRDHVDNDEEDTGQISFTNGNEDAAFVQAVMAPGVEVELLGEQVEL